MVKREVRRDSPSFRLEHDGRTRCRNPPQQVKLLVGQRAARRVVPELETLAVDFADAGRQLKPDLAWKGVRPEGVRVSVEDRCPLPRDPRVLPPAARPRTGMTSGPS